MKETVIYVTAGVIAGLITGLAGGMFADHLLKNREKEQSSTRLKTLCMIASAIVGGIICLTVPLSPETVFYFLLLMSAGTVTITDVSHRLIPNETVIAVLILKPAFGIPYLLGYPGFPEFHPLYALAGMAVCFILFILPSGMGKNVGFGDVKLAAAVGFCAELYCGLASVAVMGMLVLVYVLYRRTVPVLEMMKTMLPVGPFLAGGMLISMLFIDTSMI